MATEIRFKTDGQTIEKALTLSKESQAAMLAELNSVITRYSAIEAHEKYIRSLMLVSKYTSHKFVWED